MLIALAVFAWSLPSRAFDSLFKRLDTRASLTAAFPESESHADVEDGFLLGVGMERLTHMPDGTLHLQRTRKYTRIRNPDTGKLANLPEPWEVTANVTIQSSLRMVLADTRFQFKRSGDTVFPDYKFSEHEAWLFDHDHSVARASPDGRRMTHQEFNHGKLVKNDTYDYAPQSVPIELVGLLLSAAVQRQIDQFDFQMLVPDGGTHGVTAQTHRTSDVRTYAKGYRIPPRRLLASESLAVVDLRLSSPIKRLFFPHHFYFAYSVRDPWKLMMLWGGDPDKNLQEFRSD